MRGGETYRADTTKPPGWAATSNIWSAVVLSKHVKLNKRAENFIMVIVNSIKLSHYFFFSSMLICLIWLFNYVQLSIKILNRRKKMQKKKNQRNYIHMFCKEESEV